MPWVCGFALHVLREVLADGAGWPRLTRAVSVERSVGHVSMCHLFANDRLSDQVKEDGLEKVIREALTTVGKHVKEKSDQNSEGTVIKAIDAIAAAELQGALGPAPSRGRGGARGGARGRHRRAGRRIQSRWGVVIC